MGRRQDLIAFLALCHRRLRLCDGVPCSRPLLSYSAIAPAKTSSHTSIRERLQPEFDLQQAINDQTECGDLLDF